jgi:hypothetical protein
VAGKLTKSPCGIPSRDPAGTPNDIHALELIARARSTGRISR